MKKLGFILSLGVLIFSFQNCSSPEQLTSNSNDSMEVVFDKIRTMPIQLITFFDHDRGLKMDVVLSSGRITAFEEMGAGASQDYCLDQSEIDRLNAILSDSSVCEPGPSTVENCIQMYVDPPYASVTIGDRTHNLGERYNPCDPPTDLCENRAEELRSYAGALIRDLESNTCE